MRSAPSARPSGPAAVIVAVYAVLALAATGRSTFQIIDRFSEAPVAFSLSAVAAAVYIVATVALAAGWDRVATSAIVFELAGVLVIGGLSLAVPGLLGTDANNPLGSSATVWSAFGAGYLFVPLVLPLVGLWWLARKRRQS